MIAMAALHCGHAARDDSPMHGIHVGPDHFWAWMATNFRRRVTSDHGISIDA
jgi:hypothetical protein